MTANSNSQVKISDSWLVVYRWEVSSGIPGGSTTNIKHQPLVEVDDRWRLHLFCLEDAIFVPKVQ